MLRRPHEYDGHCDADMQFSDMQCSDNTTAEIVVVIAAAVVGNARSYSRSFSVHVTTAAAATSTGLSERLSELQQSFRLLVATIAAAATSACNTKAFVLATAVSAVLHAQSCASNRDASIACISKDDAITTHKKGATSEATHLMESLQVLTQAHELSMNGLTKTTLPTANSPQAVVYPCYPMHLGKMSIPFACQR